MGESWEYTDAETQCHVHGLHLYPARMIPQIANRLIRENSLKGQTVLDPFCGSGSVLVEAQILGRNAIGIDINPLAIMIARAKNAPIDPIRLAPVVEEVLGDIQKKEVLGTEGEYRPNVFYFRNIYHWFKKEVINDLSTIQECIDAVESGEEEIRNLLRVCFSATILKASNIAFNDNPYFARAKTGKALEKHSPNAIEIFEKNVRDYVTRTKEFYELRSKSVSGKIIEHDSRDMPLERDSVDLVVTSPPYGEESHTMSYSRFTRLSLRWLGFSHGDAERHVSKSLGGTATVFRSISPALDSLHAKIAKKDGKRAKEVFSFFWDYKKCLDEIYRVLRPGRLACIVIGDRTALGLKVSNGQLTEELGRLAGFKHQTTYHRNIPRKVLPRSDYKVDLINKEEIILLKKGEGESQFRKEELLHQQ